MTTTTSGGLTRENPAQRGRFKSDDDHRYRPATTTTTSLASKNKPEVVLFGYSNVFATAATFLASNREPEVVLSSCFNTSATTLGCFDVGGYPSRGIYNDGAV